MKGGGSFEGDAVVHNVSTAGTSKKARAGKSL